MKKKLSLKIFNNLLIVLPIFATVSILSSCSNVNKFKQNNIWILNRDVETNNLTASLTFMIDENFDNPINLSLARNDPNLYLKRITTNVVNKQIIVDFTINQNVKEDKEFYFSVVFKFINSYGNEQKHEIRDLHISFIPKYNTVTVLDNHVYTSSFNAQFAFLISKLPSSNIQLSMWSKTPELISLESPSIEVKEELFYVSFKLSEKMTIETTIELTLTMNFINSYGLEQKATFLNLIVDYTPA